MLEQKEAQDIPPNMLSFKNLNILMMAKLFDTYNLVGKLPINHTFLELEAQ
jgi:hypothetical protein